MTKLLSTIRRGIEYQDLVAAEALLELVNGDPDQPVSVSLEDRRGGSFDDVAVTYADRVVWKQIKWAQNPVPNHFRLTLLLNLNQTSGR